MAWGRPGDDLSTGGGRPAASWERPAAWGQGGGGFPTPPGTVAAAARWRIDGPSTSPQPLLLFQGSLVLQSDNTKALGKGRESTALKFTTERDNFADAVA